MRVGRKDVSYVRQGLGVRVSITIDGDSLTRPELKEAGEVLASKAMLMLTDAKFVHAELSKIKVR